MLISLEQKCQELCLAIEQMSERQELGKQAPEEFHRQILQELKELEEQKSKQALELLGQKHRLERSKKKKGACQVFRGDRAACGGMRSYRYFQ